VRSHALPPHREWLFLLWTINFFVLMWAGGKPAEGHYVVIARSRPYYFAYFLVLLPLLGKIRAPAAAAREHQPRGVARGRTAARRRHRQADGEGLIMALRSVKAAALAVAVSFSATVSRLCSGCRSAPELPHVASRSTVPSAPLTGLRCSAACRSTRKSAPPAIRCI
jgi:hypothetical protein